MRKYVLAIAAVIGMTSVAHADWNGYRHHYHGGGGCYNCYNNHGGGDPGLALFGGLVGGMIIGGMIANSNQGYYYQQPMCQTVFMGRVFDGWRWVDRYERVCQ